MPPADGLAERVAAERTALLAAATEAGIHEHDPLRPLIEAFARAMALLGDAARQHTGEMARLLAETRTAAQAEIDRAAAQTQEAEATAATRIAAEIGRRIDETLVRRARAEERRALVIAGAAVTAVLLGVAGGANAWGVRSASPCHAGRSGAMTRQAPDIAPCRNGWTRRRSPGRSPDKSGPVI